MAIRVLEEIGIQHNGESKTVEQFRNEEFDLVVTVCDDANGGMSGLAGQGETRP